MAEVLVLLSGGVDSAVCLFKAVEWAGASEVKAVTFDWGQLAFGPERKAAEELAARVGIAPPLVSRIEFPYSGPLVGKGVALPLDRTAAEIEVHSGNAPAFFPGRNLVMLAYAFGLAGALGAQQIYFGAGADDSAGYPDCRPGFVSAIQSAGNLALGGTQIEVITPLIQMSKVEIIRMGEGFGIPWELTFSCYDPVGGEPCGRCDSCTLRRSAFLDAQVSGSS